MLRPAACSRQVVENPETGKRFSAAAGL